ncbi:MAG: undecaprenyl-phosphate glucose phosphotransferase [Rhodospirillales bacterium]|nr:undecaprenyl-phosphate glucose phosphotransferase [Rhodospirillales bacterium]
MSESVVSGMLRLVDALAIAAAGLVAYHFLIGWGSTSLQVYLNVIAVSIVLTVSFFHYAGLYDFNTLVAWPTRMRQMVLLSALVVFVLAVVLKISNQYRSAWFLATFVGSTVLIFGFRGLARLYIGRLARTGTMVRNIAIVGASGQAKHLVERLRREHAPWKRIIGIFDDRRTRITDEIDGFPVLGNLDDLVTYVRQGRIQDVVITLPWSADGRLIDIISKLRALPVHIYLGSDLIGYHFQQHREQQLAGMSVLEIASAPLTGWNGIVKQVEDRIISTIALLMLSPLMLLITIAIRIDSPGPVLFRQKRYGFNNEVIVVYKFRSMYHNRPPEADVPQATRDDPRVTRVGRILRRTSLDELPQLFNVIRGEMSLIGPRPHAVEHNKKYAVLIGDYHWRHKVKPGITGWAQVSGFRGETDTLDKMRLRFEHDVYYIENWSLWFDFKILVMTAFIGWTSKNAY